ncbi:MAG: hypothetical protein AAGA55_08595 [Planctomycetota bacterium]
MKVTSKIALCVLGGLSGMASAQDFVAEFDRIVGRNESILVNGELMNAGHMQHTYEGAIPTNAAGQFRNDTFFTFCIELQDTSRDPEGWTIQKVGEAPNPVSSNGGAPYGAADEAEVHSVLAASIRLGLINEDLSQASATRTELAAIQGMIWKVLFDDSTVEGAAPAVSAAMAAIEAEMLNDPNARVAGLRAMVNADAQDQLYVVPLPAAALAGLAMLGGLAGARLRRR